MRRRGRAFLRCVVGLGLLASGAIARQQPPIKPLPPASIDDTLSIGGEAIATRRLDTRMTVPIQVNGRGPYRFIVDSGADISVIGTNLARDLQLPPGSPVMMHDITANSLVQRVKVDSLGLGQSLVYDRELPVLEERDLDAQGILGIDALVNQRLMLDFEQHLIRIEDATHAAPRLDGEIIVTARRQRGQLILTQVRANGKPVNAVVDTGAEITVGNLALRNLLMQRYAKSFYTTEIVGVTGVRRKVEMARVAQLQLGPVVFQDVTIAFADVPPFAVFGLQDQPALMLGTDLMEVFRRVSLDFHARKVRFQLRRCTPQSVAIGTGPLISNARLSAADSASAACSR